MSLPVRVKHLGRQPYLPVWQAMQAFIAAPNGSEIWFLEHEPVYTLGQAGRREHLLNPPAHIPIVHSDRGGQVTYHGPGQLIAYCLLNIKALNLGVRALVTALEDSLIDLLAQYQISAQARADAPGVYVNGAKIASLGLRIKKGYCYHGLALNIDLDLEPFSHINPCGHAGLAMTSLAQLGIQAQMDQISAQLAQILAIKLGLSLIEC